MTSSPSKIFLKEYNQKPLEYLGCTALDGLSPVVPPRPEVMWYKPSPNPMTIFYKVTINGSYLGIVDETDMFLLKYHMTKDGTITSTLYRQSGRDFWFEGFSILDRYNTEIFRAIQVR